MPKLKPLIPPDRARCQAETRTYNAFVMGGPTTTWKRCENAPIFIATERSAGPDGRRGSMSLCPACKAECERVQSKRGTVIDYTPVMPKDILLIRGGRVEQAFYDLQDAIDAARAARARHPRRVYTIARVIDTLGAATQQPRNDTETP